MIVLGVMGVEGGSGGGVKGEEDMLEGFTDGALRVDGLRQSQVASIVQNPDCEKLKAEPVSTVKIVEICCCFLLWAAGLADEIKTERVGASE